jgi:hypothetical protein
VEELLGRYRDYLIGERGLTSGTACGYVDFVGPFVATRLHGEVLDFASLTAADVTGFVLGACPGAGGRVGEADRLLVAVAAGLAARHRRDSCVPGQRGAVGGGLAAVGAAEKPRAGPAAPAAGRL